MECFDNLGIFINTRGNSKLFIYQNHTFRFMYKKAYGSQLWYCWYFFSRCCPAKLRINNAGKVTESIGRHNHDPPTCWMTPDGYDVVQCVPTKKGHQILYKGYTYVFKSKLQCGAEQWICSFRQKTEEQVPEWVSIYFANMEDKEGVKCNLCEVEIHVNAKSPYLLEHMKEIHKDIYDLHKDNPEATVGFRVEFLHMNVLKNEGDIDKNPIILGEVCETTEAETIVEPQHEDDVINMQYVMLDTKRKHNSSNYKKSSGHDARKRSWIWKYFDRLSDIIYRCNICNVVLSTKSSNTNNLNRHVRSKHAEVFRAEKAAAAPIHSTPLAGISDIDLKLERGLDDSETPYAIKTEEIYASNKDSVLESQQAKSRRSWIWSYFSYVSVTQAQCRLCRRHINHGGNATGNMNRHLKMIHNKTALECDNSWIWKVFESDDSFYTCKICQHKLNKTNSDTDVNAITNHLKREHGVVSGDQIITGAECDFDEH